MNGTENTFRMLTDWWHKDTDALSAVGQIIRHPAYQSIILMGVIIGEEVTSLILRELRDSGGVWYPALVTLTGENPIDESIRGKVQLMRQCWVDWGIEHGYLKEE
jgi:hypothetical protein